MSETIFGKILTGEIPSFKVYEDGYVYAFWIYHKLLKDIRY